MKLNGCVFDKLVRTSLRLTRIRCQQRISNGDQLVTEVGENDTGDSGE